jgi:AraC family transcriptional regulator
MEIQTPEIITLKPFTLVGMHMTCTLETMSSPVLWQQFMPKRKHIPWVLNNHHYSVHLYGTAIYNESFSAATTFEKWVACAVTQVDALPEGMAVLPMAGGRYAKFTHRGVHDTFKNTMQMIFTEWLPKGPYRLADRPHFEVMTEKYLGMSNPDSEEYIYIPIT